MDKNTHISNYKIQHNKTTKYWIMPFFTKQWKEYAKYTDFYLTFSEQNRIKKNDIIFLYVKGTANGFGGIVKSSSKCVYNKFSDKKGRRIFKDQDLNNFIIRVSHVTIFDVLIKTRTILPIIKSDEIGYSSAQSFSCKFLRNGCIRFPQKGKLLLKNLLDITIETDTGTDSDVKPKKTSKSKNNKKFHKERGISTINKKKKHILKFKESKNKNNKICDNHDIFINTEDLTYDEKVVVSEEQFEMNINKSCKTSMNIDSEDDKSIIEDSTQVPIMICTCQKFKFPKKRRKRVSYFKNHYKTCQNCDTTSGNNIELCSIFDDAYIKIVDTLPDESEFCEALHAYWNQIAYTPKIRTRNGRGIKIFYIKDHKIYNECLLVCWMV